MNPTKIVINGQVVELRSDGIPVELITQEQYVQLTDDEKQKSTLYLVEEAPFVPASVSIQEYDTELDGCQWHVRKWSNGYVEMSGHMTYTSILLTATSGATVYTSGSRVLGNLIFPVPLTIKYSEHITPTDVSMMISWAMAYDYSDPLKGCARIVIVRYNAPTTVDQFTLEVYVTGRWK